MAARTTPHRQKYTSPQKTTERHDGKEFTTSLFRALIADRTTDSHPYPLTGTHPLPHYAPMSTGRSAMPEGIERANPSAALATGLSDTILATSGKYARNFRAPSTLAGWDSNYRVILALADDLTIDPPPFSEDHAAVIVATMAERAYTFGYIRRIASTLRLLHRCLGAPDPCGAHFQAVMDGIARQIGDVHPWRKDALRIHHLRAIYPWLCKHHNRIWATQAWIILTLGYFAALRRSEIAALLDENVFIREHDLLLTIYQSKTNQTGKLETVHVTSNDEDIFDIRRRMNRWQTLRPAGTAFFRKVDRYGSISPDPLTGADIADIVKACISAIGLDPADFGAHSLRAGFITDALLAGVDETIVARYVRHASLDSLQIYLRADRGEINIAQRILDRAARTGERQ